MCPNRCLPPLESSLGITHVVADLFGATKTLWCPDDQHKGQCCEGTHPRMRHQSQRFRSLLGFKRGGGIRATRDQSWATWATRAVSKSRLSFLESGGREGIRTLGLLVANEGKS